jgi:hypothetical protein
MAVCSESDGGGVLAKQGDEVIYTDKTGRLRDAIVVHTDTGDWVTLRYVEVKQRLDKKGDNGLPFFLTEIKEVLEIAPPATTSTRWHWHPIPAAEPMAASEKPPTPPAGVV